MRDPAQKRTEIKALTSLRGLAAMAVVLQHFSSTAQWHAEGWIPSLVPHGYMAVDFFFVLSGFIMSYTYLAGFESLGLPAYGPFLWKRVARIFPLGIAITAIILFLGAIASFWGLSWLFINEAASNAGLGKAVLVNLLHLQGFLNDLNLNDPSWSVSVELGAYLLFPALIFLNFRAPRWITVLYTLLSIGVLLHISTLDPHGGFSYRWAPLDLWRCVAEFGFGMLAYRAFTGTSKLRAIGSDRGTWAIAGLSAAGFLFRNDLMAAASFPFVVLAFALNRGTPSRLLSTRVPYFLGTISFSIYLVHHVFRAPEMWLVLQFHPGKLPMGLALAYAAIGSLTILPFAALAYYGIERPGRTALNSIVRKFGRRIPVPAGMPRRVD